MNQLALHDPRDVNSFIRSSALSARSSNDYARNFRMRPHSTGPEAESRFWASGLLRLLKAISQVGLSRTLGMHRDAIYVAVQASEQEERLSMTELKHRVALVTGGSRGIGKAICLSLAEAGAAVAVNYRERASNANAVVNEIRDANGRAEAFRCDVSLGAPVREMVRAIAERLGAIDILVNNAGIAATNGNETEEAFDRAIAVHLKSAFLCTEAILAGMRERRWGRIVHLSAMGARAGSRSVAYGAAKAGLEGLMRSYALQVAKDGVTVNAVAPGLIATEMTHDLIKSGTAMARISAGRPGTAEEISQAVVFLVRNGYVNGQTIAVNGGASFI